MAFETKNLSGALFKNDRKESDNHPDYKGSCKIDDDEYWVSGWINTPRGGGTKYVSLKFNLKDDAPAQQSATPKDVDFSSDIPF